jgi:hypothetical protein
MAGRGRGIGDDQLTKLLELYRSAPPSTPADFRAAAAAVGVCTRTARRAWLNGWTGTRPLREALLEEQAAARAALRREELRLQREQAGQLAVEDAAVTAAAEAMIARGVRGHATSLLAALADAREVVKQLVSRLKLGAETIPLEEAPAVIKAVVGAVRDVSGLSQAALVLERLRVGDPSLIIGVKPLEAERPLAELEAELAAEHAAAQRALERARAAGDGTPSDGGDGGVVH